MTINMSKIIANAEVDKRGRLFLGNLFTDHPDLFKLRWVESWDTCWAVTALSDSILIQGERIPSMNWKFSRGYVSSLNGFHFRDCVFEPAPGWLSVIMPYIKACTFENCRFLGGVLFSGAEDCNFNNCDFLGGDLDGSTLVQNSKFLNCSFTQVRIELKMRRTYFDGSVFAEVKLNGEFISCSMRNTAFNNSVLNGCLVFGTVWTNTVWKDCKILHPLSIGRLPGRGPAGVSYEDRQGTTYCAGSDPTVTTPYFHKIYSGAWHIPDPLPVASYDSRGDDTVLPWDEGWGFTSDPDRLQTEHASFIAWDSYDPLDPLHKFKCQQLAFIPEL